MILILVHVSEKRFLGANPTVNNHTAVWYMPKDVKAECRVELCTAATAAAFMKHKPRVVVVCSEEALTWAESNLGLSNAVRTSPSCKYGNVAGASAVKNGCRVVTLPTIPMIRSSRQVKFFVTRLLQRCSPVGVLTFAPPIYFEHKHIGKEPDMAEPRLLLESPHCMLNVAGEPFHPVIMSVDLETKKAQQCIYTDGTEPRFFVGCIDLIGFSVMGYFAPEGSREPPLDRWAIYTFTMDFNDLWHWEFGKWLMATSIPKVMSNGGYDMQYLLRWGMPPCNYVGDSEYMWRSMVSGLAGWYSLQDQTNVLHRDSVYWKDGRDAKSRKAYQVYCAYDCHNTALNFAAQLAMLGGSTFRNYVIRFARMPTAMYSSLHGMELDENVHAVVREEYAEKLAEAKTKVRKYFGCNEGQSAELLPYFKGMVAIAKACGTPDVPHVDSTGKDAVRDLSAVHPMFSHTLGAISAARRYQKWLSTYIDMSYFHEGMNGGTDMFTGRRFLLWTLQSFGTDTGRFSSNGSAFWVGTSAHTLPSEMRKLFKAPDGYCFVTSDAPQSESRVTAHEAQCEAMKSATESDHDFHALNASAFFGVPYEDIYCDEKQKTLNKPLRDLSKRTNHGANYNMGAWVMLTTMGIEYVRKAQVLLNLPPSLNPQEVCVHLLTSFAARYKEVKFDWVVSLILELCTTGRLTYQVSGFAPLMVGDPVNFKPDLNTAIATKPQGTSAYVSIVGTMQLFNDYLYNNGVVRPVLQLHDENIGLARVDTPIANVDATYLTCCANSNTVHWLDGTTQLSIPVGDVVVGKHWNELKLDPKPRSETLLNTEDYLP